MEQYGRQTPADVLEKKQNEIRRRKHQGRRTQGSRMESHKGKTTDEILERMLADARCSRNWIRLVWKLTATVLTVYLFLGVLFGLAVVQGESMYPNLKTGDLVLLNRLERHYSQGDIVILNMPADDEYIKRIIAMGGDTVDMEEETGVIKVNGEPLEEKYIFSPTYQRQGGMEFPVTVPEGYVFVLGDNRSVSRDSREIGMVKTKQIEGQVLLLFRFHGTAD